MATVFDVAKYILEQQGRTTTMKLQKLVYYAQVWAVVEGDPLFDETVKAWAQGPVVPALFAEHKGRARIDAATLASGDSSALDAAARTKIDEVLAFYGDKPAGYLSKLTHYERPWLEATERGERAGHASPTISIGAIRAFYRGRTPDDLEADYQMSVARDVMDEHKESLARLAL